MILDETDLDRAFGALADPVRRAILVRLSAGEATLTELAEPFPITMQAVSRHVQVLETAGLIVRGRDAQRRPCRLEPLALGELSAWIERYRAEFEQRFRRLDAVLNDPGPEPNPDPGRGPDRKKETRS